jgi:Pentapeptide repeats (9 copies)
VTIAGTLDLTPLGSVGAPFRCSDCRLDGSLLAANVTFQKRLDLGGLFVRDGVDFNGATFEAPALFGSEFDPSGAGAEFARTADFSLATFHDLVSFQGTLFDGTADFRLARFQDASAFDSAQFHEQANFTGAVFSGPTRFDEAGFAGEATFDRAAFRSGADFRVQGFELPASFAGADFEGSADFSLAVFRQGGVFDGTRFAQGASFAGGEFSALPFERGAAFEGVSSQKGLDFTDATFSGIADFRELAAAAVSFDGIHLLGSRTTLLMGKLSANDLVLPVAVVDRVGQEARDRVLSLIESSAKARGDIGLANDAHYRRRILASHREGWARRTADVLFYRGVAGYFVRPLNPLMTALALALLLALWREFRPSRPWPRPVLRVARVAERGLSPLGRVLGRMYDSVALVGRGSADPAKERPVGPHLERLAYRVLVVCALIGLANSNPTLRQMFDALL